MAVACTVNDSLDDVINVGEFVPTVYWDLPGNEVVAGDSVEFTAQYYSTLAKSEITTVEAWYSIDQKTELTATCPLFTSTGLSFVMQSEADVENARPLQQIMSYANSEALWNESKRCYIMTRKFPVSFTLNTSTWGNQKEFDNETFYKYFPSGFLELFRDSLYKKMAVPQFRKLLTVDNPRVTETEFNTFVDTINDSNLGTVIKIKDAYVQHVKDLMYSVPTDSLLYDSDPERGYFSATYAKSFSLKARLKVYDKDGNIGVSDSKDVKIN